MELHYNAFISYRHHPDDIRVAEQIHRCLERFHVPAAIRKRCGKIQRLFRDKDELPITSNLTDDITKALKNADYLIVICSEHTGESVWVQREIELFLTTHDRSKVLTVLASGEPRDTIPEILQYEDITDPVTGKTLRQSVEPLSCDWRMPKAKRMREELPRLAAALLGCGYDELRQRQRQYRNRRIFAGLSAALALCACLTAYFLYTSLKIRQANERLEKANQEINQANDRLEQANREIQSNLSQALKNQSQYLAASAQERLSAGDRLTAMALAVAALPQAEGDRPYVGQAELALSQALGAYNPTEKLSAVGAFTANAKISAFCVSPDANTLYATDSSGRLYIWDTHSFVLRFHTGYDEAPTRLSVTARGDLLVHFSLKSVCLDPSGNTLWSLDCRDMAQLSNGTLLALYGDALTAPRIDYVEPVTGQVLSTVSIPSPEGEDSLAAFSMETYSETDPILLNYTSTGLTRKIYALSGDRLTYLCHAQHDLFRVSCDRQGNALILMSDGTGANNGRIGDMWYSEPVGLQVLCVDTATGQLRWQYDFQSFFFSNCRTLCQIPGKDLILCQYANEFLVLDLGGNLVNYGRATAVPVIAGADENEFWGILQDGNIFFYPYGDSVYSMDYLLDGITSARVNDAYYIATDTNQIIAYRNLSDTPQAILAQETGTVVDSLVLDDHFLTLTYTKLSCYRLADSSLLWSLPVSYNHKLLGADETAGKVWLINNRDTLVTARLSTGEQEELKLPAQIGQNRGSIYGTPKLIADQARQPLAYSLYYPVTNYDGNIYIARYDPDTEEYILYDHAPLSLGSCSIVAVWNEAVWCYDTENRSIRRVSASDEPLCTELTHPPFSLTRAGECYIVSKEEILNVSSGETRCLEVGFDAEIASVFCHGSSFVLLLTDGTLVRCQENALNADSMDTVSVNLALPDLIRSRMQTDPSLVKWYETKDGELIVSVAGCASLIHTNTWQLRAQFTGCVGYLPNTDRFVIQGDGQLNLYSRYTTAQLLEKATDALGDYALPAETKAEYGLE